MIIFSPTTITQWLHDSGINFLRALVQAAYLQHFAHLQITLEYQKHYIRQLDFVFSAYLVGIGKSLLLEGNAAIGRAMTTPPDMTSPMAFYDGRGSEWYMGLRCGAAYFWSSREVYFFFFLLFFLFLFFFRTHTHSRRSAEEGEAGVPKRFILFHHFFFFFKFLPF